MTPKQIKDAADRAEGAVRNAETGQFIKGKIGGPGRPKGARNRLGEAFLEAMAEDFDEHGPAVIEAVRTEKPDQYLKVIASILPKELNLNVNEFEAMSDDELIERLRQLDAVVRPFLSAADAGEDGERVGAQTAH